MNENIKQFLQTVARDFHYEVYMQRSCNMRGPVVARVVAAATAFNWVWGAIACYFMGHVWEDHSMVGPDSGNMDMQCTRCGKAFHHQLY